MPEYNHCSALNKQVINNINLSAVRILPYSVVDASNQALRIVL